MDTAGASKTHGQAVLELFPILPAFDPVIQVPQCPSSSLPLLGYKAVLVLADRVLGGVLQQPLRQAQRGIDVEVVKVKAKLVAQRRQACKGLGVFVAQRRHAILCKDRFPQFCRVRAGILRQGQRQRFDHRVVRRDHRAQRFGAGGGQLRRQATIPEA